MVVAAEKGLRREERRLREDEIVTNEFKIKIKEAETAWDMQKDLENMSKELRKKTLSLMKALSG